MRGKNNMGVQSITLHVIGFGNDRDIHYRVISNGRKFTHTIHSKDAAFDAVAYQPLLEAQLNEGLAASEVEKWINDNDPVVTPLDAAIPRYLSTWRSTYKDNKGLEAVRLAALMKFAVDLNQFSNPQMNNAWNKTGGERIAFLGRLETKRLKHVDLNSEVSE